MKRIISAIVITVCCCFISVGAQELQSYSGKFHLKNLGWQNGYATYTYKPADDGTRIFEGDFKFVLKDQLLTHTASGKFNNNHQIGTWTFYTINNKSGRERESVIISFNDKGYIEGPFEQKNIDKDINIKTYIKNGHPVGKILISRRNYKLDGEYDTKGKPIGNWTLDMKDRPTIYWYPEKSESPYYIDDTTGDKISSGSSLDYEVHNLFSYIDNLDSYLLRDSHSINEIDPELVENPEPKQIFKEVEQPASFPGGSGAMMRWMSNNIRYPEVAQQNNISGKVIVQFVVEQDGSISSPTVLKGVDPNLDKEALRIVKRMPKWTPGKNNGQAVRSYFTVPVTFNLCNM